MERGLLWLPLLAVFIGLTWAGWKEYQKLQVYEEWAKGFDRSKYDIYAALGQKGDQLTWGQPTASGVINCQTLTLTDLQEVQLSVEGKRVKDDLPQGKTVMLVLQFQGKSESVNIPFTDPELAQQWGNYLNQEWLQQKPA
ncbi:hypothetical protein PMG71_18345 [Roseofilum sp. BLCC_M154]|uniref:Uncharacterized protein n=1 Tax=Roseofilum acuticapitatum BLCC-M154 TaxID=3022444 RepID=A0ABT7AWZ3_9CYAN|nr:hypothetical protein [Roseofilum acuticapitatum]MDJ1171395.1 hypothetical protein [Roseofilum acuticapitatum BLCC-M154]